MTRSITSCSTMILLLLSVSVPGGAAVLLDADFEGQTVDQPVGLGGAAAGEPVDVYNCVATVRNAPFPSTCLEIDDETDFGTGYVIFGLLDDTEVVSGTVAIDLDFWFAEINGYVFGVREYDTSMFSFNTIYINVIGQVRFNDANGYTGVFGTYEPGRAIHMRIIHDLDAGTYDLWWDGEKLLDDRAHGITERGIGTVMMGTDHDLDLDGLMYIDNLKVETEVSTAHETAAWGDVKAHW
jgi:hypothetical protein